MRNPISFHAYRSAWATGVMRELYASRELPGGPGRTFLCQRLRGAIVEVRVRLLLILISF